MLRYGYGFNAIRNGKEGAQSIGLLFQYNFEKPGKNQIEQAKDYEMFSLRSSALRIGLAV